MKFLAAVMVAILSGCAAPSGDHAAHAPAADPRVMVQFPEMLRTHTLANMRDHLLALAEIQDQLARGGYDKASDIAEQRLGMSSLGLHGAHEVAKVMPQAMQDIGTAMHRSASRFALVAQEASVDRKLERPLAALAQVTQACVACHAAYQLK